MEPARKRARSDSGESAASGGKDSEAPTSPIVPSKPEVPAHLWDELSSAQRKGVRWLWRRHWQGQGGVLADEPGAGKTSQLLGYASALQQAGVLSGRRGKEPEASAAADAFGKIGMLVVCPPLRVPKWHTEFVLKCPALCVHKAALVADGSTAISAALRDSGVLILSYEVMLSAHRELVSSTEVLVVDDDGRGVRNPHSDLALAAKRFRTPRRLLLARRPVDRLEELWSFVDFTRPGSLGALPVFSSQLGTPIESMPINAGMAARALAAGCASALRNMTVQGIICRAAQGPGDNSSRPPSWYLSFVRPLQRHLDEGNVLQREDVEAQQLELKRMLRAMMQSIEDCAEYDLGIPTWTGKVGAAGVPPPPVRSVEAERRLRSRLCTAMQQFASLPAAAGLHWPDAQPELLDELQVAPSPEAESIAGDILRAFLEPEAGPLHKLTTDQVISTLALAIPADCKELFKGLLQHLCVLESSTWSLKRSFWPIPGVGRDEVEQTLRIRLAASLQQFASMRAAASAAEKQLADRPLVRPPLLEKGQCQVEVEVKEKTWKAAPDAEGLAESILRAFWDDWAGPEHWLTTDQVLWKLAPTVPPESKDLFKNLLHLLCTLSKAENETDQSAWLLKKEFWPNARRGDALINLEAGGGRQLLQRG